MGNDLGQSGVTLAAGLVAIVVLMGVTMLWAVRRRHLSVVDTLWGLGFVVVAVVAAVAVPGVDGDPLARWLLLVLPGVWGLRLAWHLHRRNSGKPEDPRYVDLVERSGGEGDLVRIAAAKVFGPQALVMFLVATPLMVGVNNDHLPVWLAVLGALVWLVGFVFESVGDAQLAAFKADPQNQGQVMDRGLWRYTRHPNYFGDACVWWGIWLVAASSWAGLVTVVGPLAMTYFLAGKTGKPLTEASMSRSKPGYADYVRRTSGFLPLPPRG
ncbi:DUF1295 domain-containing protein [Solicola sp. PLA-1-18]|uniref:DUF1295 domain-containing protein n=1 Tax=Solicola sp. PLA-1-18 TaxID=3380532 RepID=UPI003B7773D2